ncbi:CaiB/BaiF CoA-transferase family protein [uncultured Sneathiella sp.]|uniref:CaiB/BaiF CoA transferase family protein n=1 Tax=uncultured Sneathiella sp. TaxID=879315 RepID=UPI002592596F|nr:CaiB/BaiF CoA-transferase family protein [uncultured Sneathiella sp.]
MNEKPLAGIRVLELGAYISAPYAGSILCALGAEVVKIEPVDVGEAFRRGVDDQSPYFVQYNSGKKSLALNLKDPKGIEVVKSMLLEFDVVLENYRAGKMASLGLGADDCRAINSSIIYASVSGFGSGGPLRDRPAYDSIGQSMGGLYSILSDAGNPQSSGTCIADMTTAIGAAMGIIAALFGRERDPERQGTNLETSIFEAVSLLTVDAVTQMHELGDDPTRESRLPQGQNYCLKTASGESITVHMSSSQKFWKSLTEAIDLPELASDPLYLTYEDRMKNFSQLKILLQREFSKYRLHELEERLDRSDVPHAPVLTLSQMVSSPQASWLQLFDKQADDLPLVRLPWRFDGKRPTRSKAVAKVGEHSREILESILDENEFNDLFEHGITSTPH